MSEIQEGIKQYYCERCGGFLLPEGCNKCKRTYETCAQEDGTWDWNKPREILITDKDGEKFEDVIKRGKYPGIDSGPNVGYYHPDYKYKSRDSDDTPQRFYACHQCQYLNRHQLVYCMLCGNKLEYIRTTLSEARKRFANYKNGPS